MLKRSTFTLFAAGAVLAPRTRAGAQTDIATVRLGCAPSDTFALALYARDQGFFKDAGLNVDITLFPVSGAIPAAVASGALDAGCSNWGALANAHTHNIPIAVIAPGGVYTSAQPTTQLVVARASTLQTAKDLNGKTVALSNLRDTMHAAMLKWSEINGGDSKSLKFIEFPPSEMKNMLTSARVDAAMLNEPALSFAMTDLKSIGKPFDAISNPMMISAHYASNDWLAKNPAVAKRLIAAFKKAATWANANHPATATMLEKYAKIPPAAMTQMNRTTYTDTLDVVSIQPQIDVMAQYGFLAKFPIVDTFWSQVR